MKSARVIQVIETTSNRGKGRAARWAFHWAQRSKAWTQ